MRNNLLIDYVCYVVVCLLKINFVLIVLQCFWSSRICQRSSTRSIDRENEEIVQTQSVIYQN